MLHQRSEPCGLTLQSLRATIDPLQDDRPLVVNANAETSRLSRFLWFIPNTKGSLRTGSPAHDN